MDLEGDRGQLIPTQSLPSGWLRFPIMLAWAESAWDSAHPALTLQGECVCWTLSRKWI